MKGQIGHYINYKNETPVIGIGATILHFTDRSAGTVVKISKSGKTVWVQADISNRTDSNGMSESQSYQHHRNPTGKLYRVSLRKDGQWRIAKDGRKVIIGHRDHYHDYGF